MCIRDRGMPQLNPEFWISQIFWLTLTFGILYVVLSKLILPKISANLELRKSQIQENIEAADKHREDSESKLKEYEKMILKSKLEAKNIFKNKTINKSDVYDINHVDRVGAGDSFTGAVMYGFLKGWPEDKIISFSGPLYFLSLLPEINLLLIDKY